MTPVPGDEGRPPRGLYEQLVSEALGRKLESLDPRLLELAPLSPEDAHSAVAQYIEHILASRLSSLRGEAWAERHERVVRAILEALAAELPELIEADGSLALPLQRLLAIHKPEASSVPRPDTPLARSALLTGTRDDPSLASQLTKEIATADRIDVLCSFIRWSGLRLLLGPLAERLRATDGTAPRLRVLTTSYMGATDPRAIEELSRLPSVEVRVSYDTSRTRLHAKAWLFHRATGFGSAYVGSANISKPALTEGLEWTSKISQYELPHLWRKLDATFESSWNDGEFESYDPAAPERLRQAIAHERGSTAGPCDVQLPDLDLRPFPFQEEILDALAAEREVQGRRRQLVVAATGTGKTMIAAFDYRRWARSQHPWPSLLFIAHREEILAQALATFRAVLRDQNFGELLVGGRQPAQHEHLFCSIQSWHARNLCQQSPGRWAYVVVDEFHHAAARSYVELLQHIQPQILLGLTATPERTDSLDILSWFDGEPSAEIRLPDAIARRLLCPFQYFGVADSENLDQLVWQRGAYRMDDLDRLYTGNDVRAALVARKVREIVVSPRATRALGFCVSIAHARFMEHYFNRAGLAALSLSAESTAEERRAAKERLSRREINFLFVVDLYNEGIDIPQIDTVLFLRPTESLTVFLQQLGRGLRLHQDKDCLTVLDFIGAQHRQFRFAPRFRALLADRLTPIVESVTAGFPSLPAGCSIQLERVAQERILDNVRQAIPARRGRIIAAVRELSRLLGRPPTMREAMTAFDASLDDLLKGGCWSRLLAEAGAIARVDAPDEADLAKGLRRLIHLDDPYFLQFLRSRYSADREESLAPPTESAAEAPGPSQAWAKELDRRRMTMLHITLWGERGRTWSLEQAESRLRQNPAIVRDLVELFSTQLTLTRIRPVVLQDTCSGPLMLHAEYTRDEVFAALGHWTMDARPSHREGVLHLPGPRVDAFFVTLHKTEDAYSPTTMYEDYAVSDSLFHWQSQSTTSIDSPTGQRYVEHQVRGYTPLLFVREHWHLPNRMTAPYAFLGHADIVSHEGSRPISIVWRMRHPIPARLLRSSQRLRAG